MEQQIARIALSGVPYSADKLYSYLVPPELADACRAGVRVSVPFGRGNRRTEGFVLEGCAKRRTSRSSRSLPCWTSSRCSTRPCCALPNG